MKILIAAACTCVIAATGYFFVQEYLGSIRQADAAKLARANEHLQACRQTVQLGIEQQDPRRVSDGERCLAGLE